MNNYASPLYYNCKKVKCLLLNNLYIGALLDSSGLSKLSLIFKIIIIAIIYLIIAFALRIMYKDMKNGDKKQAKSKKTFGLEVIDGGMSNMMRKGSVIPINREVTIGRKEDNTVVLSEEYISGHHAKIYLKNNNYILEDLKSTNGTTINGEKVYEKVYIRSGDRIEIGTIVFKVIG
ncbi:FHA domain-containing protein [Clostridium pasteurianum BC1]|uniref:FHA domain-containing protein n=1 Tax=Clostridium pasteurianum BC1 TaxID=86416 RepID=R4KCU5_CLOPA|nr:FHA domain-containing protein [Clostridium pasteurianum BC1]